MNRWCLVGLLCVLVEPAYGESDPDLEPVPQPAIVVEDGDEFVRRLLSANADVLISQQEIERVRGVARQALGALLPNVSATGTAQYNYPETIAITGAGLAATGTSSSGTSGTSDAPSGGLSVVAVPVTASAQLSLSQKIISPRDWNTVGSQRRNVANTVATAQDRARTTLTTASDDVLTVISSARAAEVSRVGLRSSLDTMRMTGRKLELGSATKLDYIRTEQDVESARASVISANEALRKAHEALGLAVGESVGIGVADSLHADDLERVLGRRCPARGVAARPDVVAAMLSAEVGTRDVRDAKLAYVPYLSVTSNLGASTIAQFGSRLSFNFAATLSIPIWDGGSREAVLRSARASLREKQLQLAATERSATIQQTQTARGIVVALAAQTVSQRNRDLAAETARLTREAFAQGSGTSFDVVDAARKAREAELDLVGKSYELVRARVDAHMAAATCL